MYFSAFILSVIVERAKKCLDFSVTIYFIHFMLCSIFDSIPTTWEWWLTNSIAMIVTVVGSEFLCIRNEMASIPVVHEAFSSATDEKGKTLQTKKEYSA